MTLSAVNVKYKMRERNNIIIRKKKKYMPEKINCTRNIRFVVMLNEIFINEK